MIKLIESPTGFRVATTTLDGVWQQGYWSGKSAKKKKKIYIRSESVMQSRWERILKIEVQHLMSESVTITNKLSSHYDGD